MARQFDVVVEKNSAGYFVASVPALPGCHTQAKSLDEVLERIREAIELCLEVQGEPHESLEFVGVQRITVAACPKIPLARHTLASICRNLGLCVE